MTTNVQQDFLNEIDMKQNNTETSIRWIGISNGMLVMKSDSSNPKAKSRINKLGNEVWEQFFQSLGPVNITSLNVETNKFDETNIYVGVNNPAIKDQPKTILTIKMNSSYGRSFLNQIFNIDLSRMVTFNPWMKVAEDGTKKNRLYINYTTKEKIEWKLPEGTPEVKWVETKKGSVVDNVSQINHLTFLEEALIKLAKDNNLWIEKKTTDLGENVDTSELTAEELAELKQIKKANKVTQPRSPKSTIETQTQDDFFDSL